MPKRNHANQMGDEGHLEAAKRLLETGSSINALTFSDYGVDLHLLLPVDFKIPGKTIDSWNISNWAVHVQVKSGAGNAWPALQLEHLDTWNTGRVPVFLLHYRAPNLYMCDPWSLSLVRERARGQKTVQTNASDFALYTATDFLEEMALWVNVPPQGPGGLQSAASGPDTVCDFVAALFMADGTTPRPGEYFVSDFADRYCRILGLGHGSTDESLARQVVWQYVSERSMGDVFDWSRAEIYVRAGILSVLSTALGRDHSLTLDWLVLWMRARGVSSYWQVGHP